MLIVLDIWKNHDIKSSSKKKKKIKFKWVICWPEPNQIVQEWVRLGWVKKIVKTQPNQTNQIWLGWVLNLVKIGPNRPANTPKPWSLLVGNCFLHCRFFFYTQKHNGIVDFSLQLKLKKQQPKPFIFLLCCFCFLRFCFSFLAPRVLLFTPPLILLVVGCYSFFHRRCRCRYRCE